MFVRSYRSYIDDITSYRKNEEERRTKQALDSPQMIEANKNPGLLSSGQKEIKVQLFAVFETEFVDSAV